jgi:hypothetical protein
MKNEFVETEDRIIAALLSAPPQKADMTICDANVRF